MKFSLKRLTLLLASITMVAGASAQMDQMAQPLPVDKDVRIGKLDNGLSYYIRHNEKPKGQADFYIAQKVGSILEDDNQRGLAHFLEHMCFNGTDNFPGNGIVQWCEKNGIKFGANLNAYTSIDQTVYNVANVPVSNAALVDSVLLILHDWADGLTLDPAEIDKERGVIHQEWRRSNVGQQRIMERLLPTIYQGEKYGYRLPIGTMEVVDSFPPQALRDYYEKWYRPDQQGIIVVGDINPDAIESKIKELFSPIKMPANPAPREYLPVSDNKGTIFAIGSDPEQPMPVALMWFKTEAIPAELNNTLISFSNDYITTMVNMMLNNRFEEIMTKADSPFSVGSAAYDNFLLAKTKDALQVTAVPKGGDITSALQAAYREVLRGAKGFTASEYDRAKSEYMSRIEKRFNDKNNLENNYYVNKYVNNFLDNKYIPDIDTEYQMAQMMTQMVPVEAINMLLPQIITPDNRVVMVMMPEKDGFTLPTEEALATALAAVDTENIEAYVDEMKAEPLIPELPAPGKITNITENAKWGAQEWTLSNGVKVIVKPTTFKNDEILFSAVAKGKGTSTLPDEMANSIIAMPLALGQTGLGDYTYSDMQKYLQGKQASASFEMDEYTRSVDGSATPKDLPTLMELIYMTFRDLEITDDEFTAFQNTYANILQNQENTPQFAFSKHLKSSLYDSPKSGMISADAIRGAKRQEIVDMVHNAMANAADFTFIFVGNVDIETLKPLVEQYIATLPADPATVTTTVEYNPAMEIKAGKNTSRHTMPMETPQAFVAVVTEAEMPFTMENHKLSAIVPQILTKRLLASVREDEGAVYSISAIGAMEPIAKYPVVMQIPFPLDPEKTDLVLGMIEKEINDMTASITDSELSDVKEFLVKAYTENLEKNNSWLNGLTAEAFSGVDVMNGNIDAVKKITKEDVQNFVKEILKQGNYQVVILEPAK